jgi:hypothetical protein
MRRTLLTKERLDQLLEVNIETGECRWRVRRGPVKAGQIAGTLGQSKGRWQIQVDGRLYHRSHII